MPVYHYTDPDPLHHCSLVRVLAPARDGLHDDPHPRGRRDQAHRHRDLVVDGDRGRRERHARADGQQDGDVAGAGLAALPDERGVDRRGLRGGQLARAVCRFRHRRVHGGVGDDVRREHGPRERHAHQHLAEQRALDHVFREQQRRYCLLRMSVAV